MKKCSFLVLKVFFQLKYFMVNIELLQVTKNIMNKFFIAKKINPKQELN